MGSLDSESTQQPGGVLSHHLDGIGLVRSIGAARAAVVEAYDAVPLGEHRCLALPAVQVVSQPGDQQERLAFTPDLVVHVEAVDVYVWNACTSPAVLGSGLARVRWRRWPLNARSAAACPSACFRMYW